MSDPGTIWEIQSDGMAIGSSGTADLRISAGAKLLFDSGTVCGVGLKNGSHGSVTLDGTNSVLDARGAFFSIGKLAGSNGNVTLTNNASLLLGGQESFIGDAGRGALAIRSGSRVSVTGNSNTNFGVATEAGSSGGISVQGGGNLSVDALFIVGIRGNGFVGVGTGGMVQSSVGSLGGAPGALGTVIVDGAGSIWKCSDSVFIGEAGAGKLTVSSGGAFSAQGQRTKFSIGNGAGTTGELDVDGGGSRVTTVSLFIAGVDGAATVQVTNGGTLQTGEAAIASSSTSSGNVLVSDAGSLWTVTDPGLYVGGIPEDTGLRDGGPATLTVASGGLVLVPKVIDIGRTGKIVLSGGAVGVGTNSSPAMNTLRVAADGLLLGRGRVQGQVIVARGGKALPGNSPGILTIDGSYAQEDGSTYYAEIGGSDPGTGYDQIQVSGQATIAGNLQVRLTNGFTPTVGQTFRILNAGSVSGVFGSISQPSQAGISLTSDATGITVTISSVVAGAPVISSATTANAAPGAPFSYQIAATNNPTSFGATNLPAGVTVDNSTGLISGTPANAGVFTVPINANNAAGSGQADLTIILAPTAGVPAPPPSNLINISTRMRVLTSDNVLIGGFIITGTDPKKVLIRGIGPSLGNFGVTGVLADPTLELHQGSTTVATNDNWKINDQSGQSQEVEIVATTIPPTNDLESAILATLNPGAYTAILAGKNRGTGVGLVEVYDLAQGANSKLANISTRGFVDTGNNVMIGGLIVGGGGGGTAKVILRALGPSVPVSGALGDPTLELHDGNGATIATNDNWKINDQTGQSQEADIRATTIPPSNDLESALVATLVPGNYTAVVRGKNNTTGVGLVEVYGLQ
jgi:T5SS/PEP-CTERM-associated repeat protein